MADGAQAAADSTALELDIEYNALLAVQGVIQRYNSTSTDEFIPEQEHTSETFDIVQPTGDTATQDNGRTTQARFFEPKLEADVLKVVASEFGTEWLQTWRSEGYENFNPNPKKLEEALMLQLVYLVVARWPVKPWDGESLFTPVCLEDLSPWKISEHRGTDDIDSFTLEYGHTKTCWAAPYTWEVANKKSTDTTASDKPQLFSIFFQYRNYDDKVSRGEIMALTELILNRNEDPAWEGKRTPVLMLVCNNDHCRVLQAHFDVTTKKLCIQVKASRKYKETCDFEVRKMFLGWFLGTPTGDTARAN